MQYLLTFDSMNKKNGDKFSIIRDTVIPSPSEKIAREELGKLTQNAEDIRKMREKIQDITDKK